MTTQVCADISAPGQRITTACSCCISTVGRMQAQQFQINTLARGARCRHSWCATAFKCLAYLGIGSGAGCRSLSTSSLLPKAGGTPERTASSNTQSWCIAQACFPVQQQQHTAVPATTRTITRTRKNRRRLDMLQIQVLQPVCINEWFDANSGTSGIGGLSATLTGVLGCN